MSGEMIKRVARAMQAEIGRQTDAKPLHTPGRDDDWSSSGGVLYLEALARVAIEAMREPTKTMIDKGGDVLDDCKDSDWDSGGDGESHNSYQWIIDGSQTVIFQAMIDAALSDA